jgi:hypothetical protein
MVRKLRFQETRSTGRRRRNDQRPPPVFEPRDAMMAALALAALLWLTWLAAALRI